MWRRAWLSSGGTSVLLFFSWGPGGDEDRVWCVLTLTYPPLGSRESGEVHCRKDTHLHNMQKMFCCCYVMDIEGVGGGHLL